MKIGLSTSVIQRGRSGISQYVLALVREFLSRAAEHEFTLFVLEEDLPLFDFAREAMNLEPVEEKFRPPLRDIFWHQCLLPHRARELGLDVLHVPSYRRLTWRQPCACVGTIHDLAPFRLPKKYDLLRMFYGRVIVRMLARRQTELIAVSRTTARDLELFFDMPPPPVTVIRNGIDHARFSPAGRAEARAWAAQRHGLSEPFFLYVARLEHPAKNHARLIAAFNQFKAATSSTWQLVFGGADWHGAETIHAMIRQSPFAREIHRLGFVGRDELPTWYRAAEVFVYPSLFEGFGLPPLEAMACGCPVIVSARGALGEVTGTAAIIIDPENIAGIAAQLARLAEDENLRERLRIKGLAQARLFDWQAAAATTLEVYARADARKNRAELPTNPHLLPHIS